MSPSRILSSDRASVSFSLPELSSYRRPFRSSESTMSFLDAGVHPSGSPFLVDASARFDTLAEVLREQTSRRHAQPRAHSEAAGCW